MSCGLLMPNTGAVERVLTSWKRGRVGGPEAEQAAMGGLWSRAMMGVVDAQRGPGEKKKNVGSTY